MEYSFSFEIRAQKYKRKPFLEVEYTTRAIQSFLEVFDVSSRTFLNLFFLKKFQGKKTDSSASADEE